MLQNTDIDMKDVIKYKSKIPEPPTFVRGTRQIDAVWITKDIEIDAACFTPFYFGIRAFSSNNWISKSTVFDLWRRCRKTKTTHPIYVERSTNYICDDMRFLYLLIFPSYTWK